MRIIFFFSCFICVYSYSLIELPSYEKAGDTFSIPIELKSRVDFWKKIYIDYSSHEALIHDSEYPELIYESVQFKNINNDPNLSYFQKDKTINNLFQDRKNKLVKHLIIIQRLENSRAEIPDYLKKLHERFDFIRGKNKFYEATERIRVQVGQKDHVIRGLYNSGKYLNEMTRIFEKEGLPIELTRLPLVESAFNLNARSKVGASGIWQFMLSTGKSFLNINRAVDERNDPLHATKAAAQLLKQNYRALGSWPLAITAYNHGRDGMMRAVRSVGSTEITDIIKNYKARTFGFASSNFYAEFLAMLETEKHYRKRLGKIIVDDPVQVEHVSFSGKISLSNIADYCNTEHLQLTVLNPGLTHWVTSGKGSIPPLYKIKIPKGKRNDCRRSLQVAKLSSNQNFK